MPGGRTVLGGGAVAPASGDVRCGAVTAGSGVRECAGGRNTPGGGAVKFGGSADERVGGRGGCSPDERVDGRGGDSADPRVGGLGSGSADGRGGGSDERGRSNPCGDGS